MTVAYTYYRFVLDPGLQAVDKAGLISHINQIALPTRFANLPTQLAIPGVISQSHNGITVTLEWVYVDSSRVDFKLIIDGLNLPNGAQIGDYICQPYVFDKENVALIRPGIETYENNYGSIGPNQLPGAPIELTFEYQPQTNINAYQKLNMVVDLTIGPCGRQWSAPSDSFTGQGTGQTATPPPLIGTYRLSFEVPISKGLLLLPNQKIDHDGVRVRLEALVLDPSFTQVRLCYQNLDIASIQERKSETFDITVQMDDHPPVQLNGFSNSVEIKNGGCLGLGAAIPNLTKPNQVKVRMSNYKYMDKNGKSVSITEPWEFTINIP
jgi:hypothetical protein